jgi:hypothetical protein
MDNFFSQYLQAVFRMDTEVLPCKVWLIVTVSPRAFLSVKVIQ